MPNSERIEQLISPEALKQFEQLKSVSDANTASFEKLIAKAVELNKAVGNATTFKEINKATKEMTDNEKALAKQVDELAKANAKLQALYSEEAKKIAEVKAQQQARNQAIKEEIQLNQAAEGSLKQKQLQLKQLQREYDSLSEAERNAAKGTEMLANIQALDKELKGLEGTTGRFQRNVGNYGGALKTLEGFLADVRAQLSATKQAATGFNIAPRVTPGPSVRNNNAPLRAGDNTQQLVKYNQTVAQSSDRVQELQKQEQLLSRIVESQIAGFASATAELKSNEKALQSLAAAGLQNTEFYQVLLKDTADLKDRVGDLKEEIKALSSDTRNIDLVSGAITGMVSVFQVGASAAELLSNGNEDVQKSMQRLMALQNIAQGVQQLANDLTQKGTALNKLYNFVIGQGTAVKEVNTVATVENTVATEASVVATEGMAVATEGLSVAMKVLRGALAASGIGLLIAGVVFLIGKIQEWQQADLNLIKQQAELNATLLETLRLNKELAELTRTDIGTDVQGIKNRIAANEAYGRSQGEVLAGEQKLLEARQLAAQTKFFDIHGFQGLSDAEDELNKASIAYREFINLHAKTPIDQRGNKEELDAQKSLLQSNLDLAKETFSQRKAIVEDYVNFNNDAIAKQSQIERLNLDERRKYELFYANLSANLVIENNNRILQDEKLTMNQRIALTKSTAEQQKLIAEAANKNIQSDPGASNKDKIIAAKDLAHQLEKIEKDTQLTQQKIRDEYEKRKIAADFEVLKIRIQDEVNASQAIAENEKKSFDQRSDALYAAYEKRRQIITANYEFELQQAIKSGAIPEERIAIEQKALSEINQLTVDYGLQQQSLYKDNQDKINEIIEKGQQARQDKIAGDAAGASTELIKQLVAGQITLEQYNRQREMADHTARIESLKEEVNNATAKVLATKEGTAARFEAEKELKEKTLALNEEYNKKEIDAITKLNDLKKELASEAFDAISVLQGAQFDKESAGIQAQMDDVDRQKDREIESANATIKNADEKATAIAKIEAKAQQKKEDLERRQRQIELDRARFEKSANIAQIITSTATAIIETLKTYKGTPAGFAAAATIGAIGAINLAKAIATPLPKFAEGTDDAPGGLSWVGDAYKKELVITPAGQVMQTPAVPTVMNVPKHSIVLPDARAALESGLAVNRHGRLVQNENGVQDIKDVGRKIDTLTKVMRNKPVLNMHADQGGLTAMWQYGANWVTYADEQTRF